MKRYFLILILLASCKQSNEIEFSKIDYFPLAKEDTLVFQFNQTEYIQEDRAYHKGINKWIVKNIKMTDSAVEYTINSNTVGEGMKVNFNDYKNDTTYYSYLSNYDFIIKEIGDTIQFQIYKFPKWFTDNNKEYIEVFNEWNQKMILRKNYGIDHYHWKTAGGHHYYETKIQRVYK